MRALLTLLVAALAVGFWVYTLIDCVRTDSLRTRGLPKAAWVLIVLLIPLLGGVLWLIIGKDRGNRTPAKTGSRPMYPDDDLEFLKSVDVEKERAERIRKLEESLADLDDDTNNPKE